MSEIAHGVEEILALSPNNGDSVENLIDFANRYAVDKELRHQAVMLQMQFNEAQTDETRSTALKEIQKLVATIQKRHASASGEVLDEFAKRQEFLESQSGRDIDGRVVLSAKGLGYSYPDGNFRLSDVDLCLEEGRITGLVGENANGKSTLFRILVGQIRQMEGELEYPLLNGEGQRSIHWRTVKEKIAYVPQELPPLYGTMEENLRYAAAMHGQLGEKNDLAVAHIVARLHLGQYLDRKWQQLAGGYKLRFALARALVSKPKLLALDEPLANLDFQSQLTVLRDIRDLARSYRDPIAVIISSQHLHEIEAVADRILFLRRGKPVFYGPIDQIRADANQNVFELGTDMEVGDLRARLPMETVQSITHNGLSFVVKTDPELSGEIFLSQLIEQGVRIGYFRDISHSVKQLFESDTVADSEPAP